MTKSYLAIFIIVLVFASCNNPVGNNSEQQKVETEALLENKSKVETELERETRSEEVKQTPELHLNYPEFNTKMAYLPFHLNELQIKASTTILPSPILQNFKSHLQDHYFNYGGDSIETYFTLASLYVKSYLSIVDDQTHLYLMITQNPLSSLALYTVCYNPLTNTIYAASIQTDLAWNYDHNGNKFAHSELYKSYDLYEPLIEITDIDENGTSEIKISRMAHKGTAFTGLDLHFYEIADSLIKPLFSYSKMEYLSLDKSKITREIIPTTIENSIKLKVFISKNDVKIKIGTVAFKRPNPNEPYTKTTHELDKNLTPQQAYDWEKLLVMSFSHELRN